MTHAAFACSFPGKAFAQKPGPKGRFFFWRAILLRRRYSSSPGELAPRAVGMANDRRFAVPSKNPAARKRGLPRKSREGVSPPSRLAGAYSERSLDSLAAASFVSSGLPKVENRKNPSPHAPKPSPGVPTICASVRRRSKNSQLPMPPGHFSQI